MLLLLFLATVFFLLAFFNQLRQYMAYGHMWDAGQIHHEGWSLLFIGLGLGTLISIPMAKANARTR